MPRNNPGYAVLAGLLAAMLAPVVPSISWADTKSDVENDLAQLNRRLHSAEQTFTARANARAESARALDLLRNQLITNTARIQALEDQADRSARDLEITRQARQAARGKFSARREELSQILAAMQRLGAEPAASLLVAPGGAREAARAGILLQGLMRGLREKADALGRELDQLARLEADHAAQQQSLVQAVKRLNRERLALDVLVAERQRLVQSQSIGLDDAQAQLDVLAAKAVSLRDLLDQLQKTTLRPAQAATPGGIPLPRVNPARQPAALTAVAVSIPSEALVQPVLATSRRFQRQKGRLSLPVSGPMLFAYGDKRANGETVHGLTLKVNRGSRVRAPVDGKIVFAGPFRSYGNLLIIAPAEGFHLLLAGLGSTDVQVGQWLLAGEPVGKMTGGGQQKGVFARSKTSLYIELRKDGEPINPAPWFNSVPGKVTGS